MTNVLALIVTRKWVIIYINKYVNGRRWELWGDDLWPGIL